MLALPLSLAEGVYRLPFLHRPRFLARVTTECPSREELRGGLLFIEIRAGCRKWAHLLCPKCGDHIQLPLAGKDRWSAKTDFLRRPTLSPSIWEEATCGAHFYITKGRLLWCGSSPRRRPAR